MNPGGAILILGATSGIARAVAAAWMERGESLVLAGRSLSDLEAVASDLEAAHGRRPAVFRWDLEEEATHAECCAALVAAHPLKGALLAAGVMASRAECAADPRALARMVAVNLTGTAAAASLLSEALRARGGGFLCVLSSVAGDRGRASNYPYGATKAALSSYLEGLRASLRGSGVQVLTVKPGPVRTRMTAGTRAPLLAEPETVAGDILRALAAHKRELYTPWPWRPIMAVIRALPASLFERLGL